MRPSARSTAVLLATVAMLVVGVDYASFATTGNSLILGKFNHADATTTLTNVATGPAMRLRTASGTPPLAVNSKARVYRFNASLLGGNNARSLQTNALTFSAGTRGDISPGLGFWSTPVRPGLYDVSFLAVLLFPSTPDGSIEHTICAVGDLTSFGGNPRLYTADSAVGTNQFPGIMSGSATVRIPPNATPGIFCVTPGGSDFLLFKPLKVSFTPVNHHRLRSADQLPLDAQAQRHLVDRLTR